MRRGHEDWRDTSNVGANMLLFALVGVIGMALVVSIVLSRTLGAPDDDATSGPDGDDIVLGDALSPAIVLGTITDVDTDEPPRLSIDEVHHSSVYATDMSPGGSVRVLTDEPISATFAVGDRIALFADGSGGGAFDRAPAFVYDVDADRPHDAYLAADHVAVLDCLVAAYATSGGTARFDALVAANVDSWNAHTTIAERWIACESS